MTLTEGYPPLIHAGVPISSTTLTLSQLSRCRMPAGYGGPHPRCAHSHDGQFPGYAVTAGAWDYVTKPWEPGALETVIMAL